jgi:hypothetical protein
VFTARYGLGSFQSYGYSFVTKRVKINTVKSDGRLCVDVVRRRLFCCLHLDQQLSGPLRFVFETLLHQ